MLRAVRDLRGRRRREDGERGAVMVEFALVVILLMMLIFGIIEFSIAWNVNSQAEAAVRAGGRSGSAMSRSDSLTVNAAAAVGSVLKTVPASEPKWVMVYKVAYNQSGAPPSACGTDCAQYAWDPVAKQFTTTTRMAGSGWPAIDQQNNCTGATVTTDQFDQVGVYVKVAHPIDVLPNFIPGFPSSVNLTPYSVFKLEPSSSTACS